MTPKNNSIYLREYLHCKHRKSCSGTLFENYNCLEIESIEKVGKFGPRKTEDPSIELLIIPHTIFVNFLCM